MKDNLNLTGESFIKPDLAKILDLFLPLIIFIIIKNRVVLPNTIILPIAIGLVLTIYRLYKKEKLSYSLLGILIVAIYAYYSFVIKVYDDYFLTNLFITYFGLFLIFASILFRRPLAGYISHILSSRPIKWSWNKIIKRVYLEVTLLWAILFVVRLVTIFMIASKGDYNHLSWYSVFLSTPFTLTYLILSYLYGEFKLRNLKVSVQ